MLTREDWRRKIQKKKKNQTKQETGHHNQQKNGKNLDISSLMKLKTAGSLLGENPSRAHEAGDGPIPF